MPEERQTPNISEPQINVVLIIFVPLQWCNGGRSSSAASDSQLSVSMLAGLTTNVELLMLALDVLVEAEQFVSSTGAGVVLLVVLLVVAVVPVELV